MSDDDLKHTIVKTLSDNPSASDAFGAHAKVAKAIANLIAEEDVGRSVAITGSWGSGKSTVIKHLTDLLHDIGKGNSDIQVFIFDAWMHQNDPLRRAFLEQLIDFLAAPNLNWICPETWNKNKELLAKRLKITVETERARLTRGGAWMLISALLVPIGVACAKSLDSLAGTLASLDCTNPLVVFCTLAPYLLASLPLWTLLILLLGRLWGNDAFKQNKTDPKTPWYDLLQLLVAKTSSTTHHETQETPDPTSIEFQKDFKEMISEALASKPNRSNRKLVLVIDNLDRMDAEDALLIWSTMRIFLEVNNLPLDSALNRLWLVVPFDIQAISRIFGKAGSTEQSEDVSQAFTNSFLDKTFQIVFKVPPPVLSDWTKFLREQLESAFSSRNNPEDFDQTIQVYRLFARGAAKPVTPREIKLFVNQLVALYRQWHDEIPFAIQATYALYQNKILDPERDIAQTPIVDASILTVLNEPKLPAYLAALHFNVPENKALQVLLGKSIADALESGSPAILSDYYKIDGFAIACQNCVWENYRSWMQDRPYILAYAALAISRLPAEVKTHCAKVLPVLRRSISKIVDWKQISQVWAQGIRAMYDDKPADYKAESLQILRAVDSTPIGEERSSVAAWVEGVVELVRPLESALPDYDLKQAFVNLRTANFYTDALVALAKQGVSPVVADAVLSPANSHGQMIIEEFARKCRDNSFSLDYIDAVDLAARLKKDWPWNTLVTEATNRLRTPPLNNLQQASSFTRLMLVMQRAGISEAQTPMNQIASGVMFHYLWLCNQQNQWDTAHNYFYAILEANPSGTLREAIGNSQAGVNVFARIRDNLSNWDQLSAGTAELVVNFGTLTNMVEKAETTAPIAKIVGALVNEIGKREDVGQCIEAKLILNKRQTLLHIIGNNEFEAILKKLVTTTDLVAEILKSPFDQNASILYRAALLSPDESQKKAVLEFIAAGMRALSLEQWRSELANDGDPLGLVLLCVESGQEVLLGMEFHDALIENAKELFKKDASVKGYHSQVKLLLRALRQEFRETFLRNLRDYIIDNAENSLTGVFKIYGEELLSSGVLGDKLKADEIVRVLFAEIIKGEIPNELVWMEKILIKHPSILEECQPASRKALFGQINLEKESKVRDLLSKIFELIKPKR